MMGALLSMELAVLSLEQALLRRVLGLSMQGLRMPGRRMLLAAALLLARCCC